ncbi:cytoskeleton protein RodZ [mine drainage metagenome]|uniref:Cytoskeleton protein RodZ n=1 Tax=mine drainage metagenome TaxID=410659 RepID=A0A1J5QJH4_9ZZZZ
MTQPFSTIDSGMSDIAPPDLLAARRQAGAALRAAREAAGRNVEELAAQLKVAPLKISALESGDWSLLPDDTFARALLRSSCKALKVDPQPLLALLPGAPVLVNPVQAAQSEGSGVTMVPDRPLPRSVSAVGRPRGLWWLAVMIVLLAGGIYFWPTLGSLIGALPAGKPKAASGQMVESAVPHDQASVPALVESVPAPASSVADPAAPALVASVPVSSAARPMTIGGAELQIQSTAPSWVEITASNGKVVFSQTMQPGAPQTIQIPAGSAPLSVVVGNAPQTTLSYAGKAVDLAPDTRANVARLTLQ